MTEKNENLSTTFGVIEDTVIVEEGAKIYPNVYLLGKTKIGKGTVIYPNTTIENSEIGENCVIKSSFIEDSVVKDNVKIGPFAHLRPNSVIEDDCKIGNFVEVKNSTVGKGTHASHLAYIGDADVGEKCNIGCGAIFVNYNGKQKNKIVMGGSGASLFYAYDSEMIQKPGDKHYVSLNTIDDADNIKQDDLIINQANGCFYKVINVG
jgi:bifunctional N-acetylglucosamine-1-phosphate-uridyltransferase/glucosamine-1-phosphate-acetyltransferase GlmU-like protein